MNSFGRFILVFFAAMLSSPWGLVFGVLTFKICGRDLGNSCFCDWDDDASSLTVGSSCLGSGSWNNFSVPVSSDLVLVPFSSEENLGACQQFVVVILSISLLVVSSFLCGSMILCVCHFLYQGCSRLVPILHVQLFCFFPVSWHSVSLVPVSEHSYSLILVLGLLSCLPCSGLGQLIPWF